MALLSGLAAGAAQDPPATPAPTAHEATLSADEIMTRNLTAAGATEVRAAVRNFRFRSGVEEYTAATDGRLKVRTCVEEPVVLQVLSVDGASVRRNRLGRTAVLAGVERDRWLCLARVLGGLCTLRHVAGPLVVEGQRAFGPERYWVLAGPAGSLRARYFVDTADWRLRRVVLTGREDAGAPYEECVEFDGAATVEGVTLPERMFMTRVGVQGTGAAPARPMTEPRLNVALPENFFGDLAVHAGKAAAAPGRLDGNVVLFLFSDEDHFVMLYTNWTAEEIDAAGLKSGDRLMVSVGGAEFESRFYRIEGAVDDSSVYQPGNSLCTHNPARFPIFYFQFNKLLPRERFDDLKVRVTLLGAIQARKKS